MPQCACVVIRKGAVCVRAASSAHCACFRVLIVLRLLLSGTGVVLVDSAPGCFLHVLFSLRGARWRYFRRALYVFFIFFLFFFLIPLIRAQSGGAAHSCVLAGLVLRRAGGHEPSSGGALLVLRLRRVLLGSRAGGSRMLDGPSEEEGRG